MFQTLYVINAYLLRHEVFVTALTDFLCSMLSGSLQKGLLFISYFTFQCWVTVYYLQVSATFVRIVLCFLRAYLLRFNDFFLVEMRE